MNAIGPGMNVHDMENNNDDDDNDGGRMPSFGSAGGIGTPSSSRARMLAQQRDIQLKKRQTAIQSGGNAIANKSRKTFFTSKMHKNFHCPLIGSKFMNIILKPRIQFLRPWYNINDVFICHATLQV